MGSGMPAVLAVLLFMSSACDSGGSSRPGIGNEANNPLETPVRITAGRYVSPANAPDVRERGAILANADALKPKFQGWMNGVYVWPGESDPPAEALPCDKAQTRTVKDEAALRQSPYWFEPPAASMPPGTFESSEPFGSACAGKPPFVVEREFVVLPAGGDLSIAYTRQSYYATSVSAERVTAGLVGGRAAALILPLTPEGFGPAHVLVRLRDGTIRVSGNDIPLAELRKIAESLLTQVAARPNS